MLRLATFIIAALFSASAWAYVPGTPIVMYPATSCTPETLTINSQEASNVGRNSTTSPLNYPFTNTSGTLMVEGVVTTGFISPSSVTVTYGGVTMTPGPSLANWSTEPDSEYIYLFYLNNPPTGTNTVSVTVSSGSVGGVVDILAGGITFTGASAGAQLTNSVSAENTGGSSTTATVGLTGTTDGDYVLSVVSTGTGVTSATSPTTVSALLNVNDLSAGNNFALGQQATSGGTATTAYTVQADEWGILSAEVIQGTQCAPASGYTIAGPGTGTVGVPNTYTLEAKQSLGSNVTVTPASSNGGSFSPTTVTLPSGSPTPETFTFTPANAGLSIVSSTNNGGLANPPGLSVTVSGGPTYTFSGPTSGIIGTAYTYTVEATGTLGSNVTVTPAVTGVGGTFSPTTVTLPSGAPTPETFTFTPNVPGTDTLSVTNNGSLANPPSITFVASSNLSAFVISPSGSDSNACTVAAPCQTLTKCISMMEGSSTKLCYLRGSATVYSVPSQITLNDPTDAGETFANYPTDAICSAKIDGGSTGDGSGDFEIIEVHTSNVTFTGLQFQNFQQAAVKSVGQNHGGIADAGFLAQDNCVTGAHNNGTNGGPFSTWGAQNMVVLNNVIWNTEGNAVDMHNTQSGDSWAGADVENNYIANTNSSNPDMGCIYAWDGAELSPGTFTWKHNLCNNSGSLGNINKGIYLDDRVSGGTVTYNIVVGAGANAFWVHGGTNDTLNCNIWDLTNQGQSYSLGGYQDDGASNMSGQSFQYNIVINYGSYSQPAIDNLLGGDDVPTFASNIYHNYTGGTLAQGGITDTNPLNEDPLFTVTTGNWSYPLQSGSPYASNCSLSEMATAFGYPGFPVPANTFEGQSITQPSYFQ
jgi:hypothetical protein